MAGEGEASPRCPVCAARFRGATGCSRCGADLTPLMALLAQAHALRCRALAGLLRGQAWLPLRLLDAAERLHAAEAGRRLRLLAECAAESMRE